MPNSNENVFLNPIYLSGKINNINKNYKIIFLKKKKKQGGARQ
jgi:hypothetical protein